MSFFNEQTWVRAGSFILLCLLVSMVYASDVRVNNVKALTPHDDFIAASFSPDGNSVVASKSNYSGLFLIKDEKTIEELTSAPMAGFKYVWNSDGSGIVYRTLSGLAVSCERVNLNDKQVRSIGSLSNSQLPQLNGKTLFVLNEKGEPQILSGMQAPEALVFPTVFEDKIFLNEGPDKREISPGGDTFFLPILSPTSEYFAFEGLVTGIWIYNLNTRDLINIGRGNNLSWAPDGKYLYYDVSEDDGEMILASELWRVRPDGAQKQQLTATSDRIEQRPVVSPDGKRILFDADGAIWIGELEGN